MQNPLSPPLSAEAIRAQQDAAWNGPAGQAWIEAQPVLDQMFRPFATLLAAGVSPGQQVLEVGCGTGDTSLAVARRVAPGGGRCTGIDLSAPMIALARERAERAGVPATFLAADAQRHPLGTAVFDAIVSRFGVMFFDDPVQAFANLRTAARDGAPLCCIAWRSADENPFMTTAERAAAPWLELPARQPGVPGQFAFADRGRVTEILAASGWGEIDITPLDVVCRVPAADLPVYLTRLGPVGQALRTADEATRARVTDVLRDAFAPFVEGKDVRFVAACWRIGARAG